MKIGFLGTPPLAVAPLEGLHRAGHTIACVVAQPDRPAGRGGALREPATKVWAKAHRVPVLQPEKVRDGRLAQALAPLGLDVLVVAAYGRILGTDLLELAPFGALNVHASLLPRWRGAAPIQWALASGDTETGITIMQMDPGLDTGDVLLQRVISIGGEETAELLQGRLASVGAEAIVTALPLLAAGRLTPVRQDSARATVARILTREDGKLDFSEPAARLAARVRAFTPWPGAFTSFNGKSLKVHGARVVPEVETRRTLPCTACTVPEPRILARGEALARGDGILVGCGDGDALLLTEVQLEGKRRLAAAEFARGHAIAAGTVLGG